MGAKRLRVAPHADTMVAFLSQRIGHQIIETQGDERWYCLWLWTVDENVMGEFPMKFLERQGIAMATDSSATWAEAAWGEHDGGGGADSDVGSDPPPVSAYRGKA